MFGDSLAVARNMRPLRAKKGSNKGPCFYVAWADGVVLYVGEHPGDHNHQDFLSTIAV